jgi:hypothetical protein
MASGKTIVAVKEALVELTLGLCALRIWVFVVDTTDEFIVGLDVLWAYDVSVDLGRHVLRLAQEEVTLWSPGTRRRSSRPTVVSDE